MGNYRGNSDKVMADAAKIARRLRETKVTLEQLMKEYRCGYVIMMRAIRLYIGPEEWKDIRKSRLARGGVKTRFKKGHRPWNKIKKGMHLSPATEFKKGHIPATCKPLGTISIRSHHRDGKMRMIAVPGPTRRQHRWIPYAHYLWEQKSGAIPKGKLIAHLDGDRLNDSLDNLVVVDRAGSLALMRKNNPGCRKKAAKSLTKTNRLKRKIKARAARAAQKARERELKLQKKRELKLQEKNQRLKRRIKIKAARAAQKARERELKLQKKRELKLQKKRELKLRGKGPQLLELDAEHKSQFEAGILVLRGPLVTWWECIGCGVDFAGEPPDICPKCMGLRFVKITQRKAVS